MALVKIGKAAQMLGVEVQTLRAWEASGELIPDRRSKGVCSCSQKADDLS